MTTPSVSLSLIIPAYNEEKRITSLFDEIRMFDGELIIVIDGTDKTADCVSRIATDRTDLIIRCLVFNHRLGKGGGVIEGLKEARAPLVGYYDADGSTSINEMLRLFSHLSRSDGAIGSRWVLGSTLRVRQGILRQMESRVFNLLIRLLFGLTYNDTQCGAKVFKKAAIDTVLPQMISRGFEFDVELLWRMQRAGYIVTEVPIHWQNRGDSRVQTRDIITMIKGLFTIRFFS
ncbi:MAG: dolichyl-phosphate beta-glucosyltransferase [Methanomicrobiales archaeon]